MILFSVEDDYHKYYKTVYCRYSPYLMGFLLGYYLYKMEIKKDEPKKLVSKMT